MRLVLIGDGDSPHLLKWARALAAVPDIELWAASSRGFASGFDAAVPPARRLALGLPIDAAGGNVAVLGALPTLVRWLRGIRPDCLHAHYLTSHGTLAWLAQRLGRVGGSLVASAWGSDILVTPRRSRTARALTRRVLRAAVLCTSDSQAMAVAMRELGAGEVMVFPFGLESMPPVPTTKDPDLVFANRGLEPLYDPLRMLQVFTAMRAWRPGLQLVVANDGSLRQPLEAAAAAQGLGSAVRFVGRLDARTQDRWYAQATWYLSVPRSDSVSVSVLEAMAHGCLPVLSDLSANRELVRHAVNGLILDEGQVPHPTELDALVERSSAIAGENRRWVQQHALFGPSVEAFVARLRALAAA